MGTANGEGREAVRRARLVDGGTARQQARGARGVTALAACEEGCGACLGVWLVGVGSGEQKQRHARCMAARSAHVEGGGGAVDPAVDCRRDAAVGQADV